VNVVRAEADQVTVRVTIRLPMCVYLGLLRLSGQQGIGVQELIRGALLDELAISLSRWGYLPEGVLHGGNKRAGPGQRPGDRPIRENV
jgi:hypothetical protein